MTTDLPKRIDSVTFTAPRTVKITSRALPTLSDGEFYVQTLYSGVSAGTELTFFLGTNPKTSEGWGPATRLFRGDIEPDQAEIYPMVKGYMAAGRVVASKSSRVKVGTLVAMRYGHESGHLARDDEFFYELPDDFDPQLATLVSHMGPICMNGILFAADDLTRTSLDKLEGSLAGQKIMVFGAGIVGMLVGMFAQWAGAREVVIVDGITERLQAAARLGMTPFDSGADLPLNLKLHWQQTDPNDTGADIVFQCTGSDYLLALGLACLREQGTVVDLGFYQQGTNRVNLGREFHHNCLRHLCAQIGSQPRHQAAGWNRRRLSEETVKFLQSHDGKIKDVLFTHDVSFRDAQATYNALVDRDPTMMQVVFHYDT